MSFQRGMKEAIAGIIGGIIIYALLTESAKDGLIPSNYVILFTIAGFLSSILLMFSFATTGIIFTLGWIFGAFLLKDILGTFDFVVYLVAPIVALIIRAYFYFKENH